jgi:hypothetical protein
MVGGGNGDEDAEGPGVLVAGAVIVGPPVTVHTSPHGLHCQAWSKWGLMDISGLAHAFQ